MCYLWSIYIHFLYTLYNGVWFPYLNYRFSLIWRLFNEKQPKDLKRFIAHVHKDWCTEMSTVSHTHHPTLPLNRTQTQAKQT